MAKPQAFLWLDLETTGLDLEKDEILEIGAIVTDFDLKPYFGYAETLGLTSSAKARIMENEYVRNMHIKNGLLKEARDSTMTIADADAELSALLQKKTTFEKGEFLLAGSGVGTFDYAFVRKYMPKTFAWLAYYVADIGVVRRFSHILSGGHMLVQPVEASYQEGVKAHRALADVKAHIQEATEYRKLFKGIAAAQGRS